MLSLQLLFPTCILLQFVPIVLWLVNSFLLYSFSHCVNAFSSGHAAYATAVDLYPNNTGVGATYFMTYHTILKESPDFIDALKMARILAKNISQSMDHKVFAYR